MPAVRARSNYWCFTWPNPAMTPDQVWQEMADAGATSLNMQKERGAATGLLHYQGYVEFGIAKRLSSLKKISREIHWESRMGTAQQAVTYVTKDDTRVAGPWTWGDLQNPDPQPGKRTDLQDAVQTLTTRGYLAVAQEHPQTFVRNYRGFRELLNTLAYAEPRSPDVTVTLLVGPPGVGKTRWVHDNVKPLYRKPVTDGFWFDYYMSDPNVLIDEFEGAASKWTLAQLNQLIDRYDVTVPVKGGMVPWKPKAIYITSNTHPHQWYDYATRQDRYVALARRFTKIIEWKQDKTGPFTYTEEADLHSYLGI